ncbi:MAG: family 78 glycoside hydrolase catalytic domain [Bacteroidota bacterium]
MNNKETKLEPISNIWGKAQWIAYEQLDDSEVVVPGDHCLGKEMEGKSGKRSVVPMFRKEFIIDNKIKRTSINISGLGHYELHLNGEKVGDRFLSPGWTNYQKRRLYNTYDITEKIKNGGNAIGVFVGNGFYYINRERYRKLVIAHGYPKLIFNIIVEYENGLVDNFSSDENCKVAPSPIIFSSIYGGEDYDARLEQAGWSNFGFNDSEWNKPVVINDSKNTLVLEEDFPLRIMQEFNTQDIFQSKTNRTIYDFGQNASGIILIKVKGNKGTKIIIRPDEILDEGKNITQNSSGKPYEFNYILKGEGIEVWQPKFTYYGFRYADVEIVESADESAHTEILEMKMLHTRNSSPTVGSFQCSDTFFNKIFELINWSIKSNMASVATDCPHREKLGWLEQAYLIGPSMHYNYDIQNFYNKIVNDMIDAQLDNGLVPNIAPDYVVFEDGFRDSPEWGSASVILPWQLYQWYGDIDVLKRAYSTMTKYIDYLKGKSSNNILYHGLGDWFDLDPDNHREAKLTPKSLTATSIYYYDLLIVAKIAKLLNKELESEEYSKLAVKVRESFQKKFYNPDTGVCSTGSQTAYALALYTEILPDEDRGKVLNNLIDAIEKDDYSLTAGDIGYHFLVRVLSENGRSDILYKMNNNSNRPGYGYQLKKGATTLTESWSALAEWSNNHMMLGHLMEWFYSGLGGIYQDHNSIAYKEIVIAPKPVGDIEWVKCSYKSMQGIISSDWKLDKDTFTLRVEVPANSKAKIIMPAGSENSNLKIIDLFDQKLLNIKVIQDTFRVSSGKYEITTRL